MLDVVGWTLSDSWPWLHSLGLCEENRSADFRSKEAATMRLTSAGWIEQQRKLNIKYARVQSQKVDIATLMIYPTASPELLPVFAVDWVVVGERCHIAVLDVQLAGEQPRLQQDLAEVFQPLGSRWQGEFSQKPVQVQSWFESLATPWAIVMACPIESLPQLRQAFGEYLQASVQQFYHPRLIQASGGPDAAEVAEYKRYHFAHFPGRKMMDNAFGTEYTQEFLTRWHFGPAAEVVYQEK